VIIGQLSFKVKKVAAAPALDLATESALMGVRSTQFSLTSTVGGDLMVSCEEGEVSMADEEGQASVLRAMRSKRECGWSGRARGEGGGTRQF
jgi:ferric-dicitrate binding protein FerR (iron transport regulator)